MCTSLFSQSDSLVVFILTPYSSLTEADNRGLVIFGYPVAHVRKIKGTWRVKPHISQCAVSRKMTTRNEQFWHNGNL